MKLLQFDCESIFASIKADIEKGIEKGFEEDSKLENSKLENSSLLVVIGATRQGVNR